MLAGSPASRLWAPDPLAKALVDASPVASAILDATGQLVHANPAWRALAERAGTFGGLGALVTREDVDGTAYTRRLARLDGPLAPAARRLVRAVEDVLAGRPAAAVPYRVHRPEGEEPYEAVATALPAAAALALVQHVDLAEREHAAGARAAAVELGLALEQARAHRRRVSRRIAALGRDLHVPITPVRLQLHLLRSGHLGPLTERQRHALEVIERNVVRWATGEAAFAAVDAEAWLPASLLDLGATAAAAAEQQGGHALQQGVRLVATPAGKPLPIRAPPDLVQDVLDTLLGRAIDATPAGGAVALEARAFDGEALAEVRDGGPGLSAREVRAALEPWAGRRPSPGVSLALPALNANVVAAGGRMYAESDGHGSGLLVGIAFPLEATRASVRGPPPPQAAPLGGAGLGGRRASAGGPSRKPAVVGA